MSKEEQERYLNVGDKILFDELEDLVEQVKIFKDKYDIDLKAIEKYPEPDPEIINDIKMVRGEKEINPNRHDPEKERIRERLAFLKYGFGMSKEEIDAVFEIADNKEHCLQENFLIRLTYIMIGKNCSRRYEWIDRKFLSQLFDYVKNMPEETYEENRTMLDNILTQIYEMEGFAKWLSTMT